MSSECKKFPRKPWKSKVICSIQTSKRMLVERLGGFRMELTNVPGDIKAMFDAVSRTQVLVKVIPSQTTEVSFKGAPQQMLNALNPNRVMSIHRHRNSSATVTVF